MQARNKWHQPSKQLQIDDLVLIKEDNLPPLQWTRGRVIELHPGQDKIVRVVTVKTKTGSFKRAVTKLCLLPI